MAAPNRALCGGQERLTPCIAAYDTVEASEIELVGGFVPREDDVVKSYTSRLRPHALVA